MISIATLEQVRTAAQLDRLVAEEFSGEIATFMTALDRSVNAQLAADLVAAKDYLAQVHRLERLVPPRYVARLIAMQARYGQAAGQYRRAARLYETAAGAYRRQREYENNARVSRSLAEIYMYLGNYKLALTRGQAALRYFTRTGNAGETARTMVNIGNIYHRRDNNRMALRYYDHAREHFVSGGGVALATVDYNRANVMANMNRLDEAEALYESASHAYHEAGMKIPELLAQYSIAYLLFLGGDFSRSLALFERVGDQFEKAGDARSSALTQLDLVELNVQINQYGSALLAGQEIGARLRDMGLRYEEARAEYFMALAELSLGDTTPAAARLKRAEQLFRKEGNVLWEGMVKFARNQLFVATGKYSQAERASREARALFVKSGDERRKIDADIAYLRAEAYSRNGSGFLNRARALLKKKLADYQRYHLHHVIGEYYYRRTRHADALEHYRHAITAVETMIADLYQDEIRYFFLVDKFETYTRTVACLLALDRVDEAFGENLHALEVLHRRPVTDERLRREVPPTLADSIAELRTSLARLSQFPRGEVRQGRPIGEFASIEQKLWREERRAWHYLHDPAEEGNARPATPTRAVAFDSGTVVSFLVQPDACGAFICANGRTSFRRLPTPTDKLRVLARKLSFVLELGISRHQATGVAGYRLLAELYQQLIGPIESELPPGRLVLIPDNFLGQIPFGALQRDDGHALKDLFDLRIVVDPASLRQSERPSGRLAGRRNAVFTVPSPSLPSVSDEGTAVRETFDRVKVFDAAAATCTALRTELQQASGFVHIATHASRSSENPLFSRLLMSDGPFFPFDLRGGGVKAELITLSGCQTAAPGLNYGNSFSLARAFNTAGARFVLATLWPVADRLTMQYMSEFYAMVKIKRDIPTAFHAATTHLQQQVADPALWGAFVLVGI